MSTHLDPEETAALRELLGADRRSAPAVVEARNFAEPKRLSTSQLKRISRQVVACLNELCADLAGSLRRYPRMAVGQVTELSAHGLFQDREVPFLIYQFEHQGNLAWLVWESSAAVAVVETILSGETQDEPVARRLSQSECRIVRQLLGQVTHRLLESIGIQFDPRTATIAQDREELLTLADKGVDTDPQRLFVHVSFEGPGGESDFRLYLPGIDREAEVGPPELSGDLPDHLGEVNLELSAFLGAVDVPLTELLDLEVGDVIPLGIPVGSQIEVYVEDRACGRARWGRKDGRLAVLLEELAPHPSTIEDPETSDRS